MRVEINVTQGLLELKLIPENQIDAAALDEMGKNEGPAQVITSAEQSLVVRKNRKQPLVD